jgi:(3,5-dihydroxyphenyl)acetyl-CoA 1,2-dioxygenase
VVSAPHIPTDLLAAAGLSEADVAAWDASVPPRQGSFAAQARATSAFLVQGQALRERLHTSPAASEDERAAAAAIAEVLTQARESFLSVHAAELYESLTGARTKSLRLERVVSEAARRVPGLTPSPAELDAERARALRDKQGVELAQGLLTSYVLAVPRAGRHLIDAMLAPTPEALERLAEFRVSGVADLGPVRVTRCGRAGLLELSNPRHLNAEDGATLGPTEVGVDLILLDPAIEVGVLRGAVVDQTRYAGQRVFGSGINLTLLYQGQIDFLFYLVRDLGYVNKLYRGISQSEPDSESWSPGADGVQRTTEKLWIAAVEKFAIGGACQLLHVMDHVIAGHGSRLYLPARKEGIIPGASNLRLPRSVGDRAARQAILSGREWTAGDPDAALLCDEVVPPEEIDATLQARIEALTSSGLVNAAANRRVMRIGQEPLDLFREYMAAYAREQAFCHLSPALVRNLEEHWNAHRRTV